jgi:hypothetical protein
MFNEWSLPMNDRCLVYGFKTGTKISTRDCARLSKCFSDCFVQKHRYFDKNRFSQITDWKIGKLLDKMPPPPRSSLVSGLASRLSALLLVCVAKETRNKKSLVLVPCAISPESVARKFYACTMKFLEKLHSDWVQIWRRHRPSGGEHHPRWDHQIRKISGVRPSAPLCTRKPFQVAAPNCYGVSAETRCIIWRSFMYPQS